jgi:hypothetical protein
MTKFMLLYSGGGMPETDEEYAAVLRAWTDWYTMLGSAVVDPGNPFTTVAKRIGTSGRVTKVGANRMASGYTIVQADSLDTAVELGKSCPVLQSGGRVSVFEAFSVM